MKAILPLPALLLSLVWLSPDSVSERIESALDAGQGYRIEIRIDGFEGSQLLLVYPYLDKVYAKDSVATGADGRFVFQGEESLAPGLYSIAMGPPRNAHFQVLVPADDQVFSMTLDVADPVRSMVVEGSAENRSFYDYQAFLADREAQADSIRALLESANPDEGLTADLKRRMDVLRQEVASRRDRLMEEHPGSLLAAVLTASTPVPGPPDFKGTEEEVRIQRLRYAREHWFDHIDIADPRMLRTPFLFKVVDEFVNKLHVQHPDTLARAIDFTLARMRPGTKTFATYLPHFLNGYARSNIVGMDAVYVHLALSYYAAGKAPWMQAEEIERIVANARALEPLLVGKVAPDFALQTRDGTPLTLSGIESEYTVLVFWRDDCNACERMFPHLLAFRERFAGQGAEILAVCTSQAADVLSCWDAVDRNGLEGWIHAADPLGRSGFGDVYRLHGLPQIYILGPDKEILSKRFSAKDLETVFTGVLQRQ